MEQRFGAQLLAAHFAEVRVAEPKRLQVLHEFLEMLGVEVLQTCLSPVDWTGFIEALADPYLTPDWQLRLRIVDFGLYDEVWNPGLMTGLLWEVTERLFLPACRP